jgi:tetratricopeptide (TPR) repeat protein
MALMIKREGPLMSATDEEMAYKGIQPLIKAKKYDLAIMALEKLIEKYPDFALAHNDLGVLHYNNGQKEKALSHHEKAFELQPDNITIQKNLANYYHIELGKLEEAMQIYLKILNHNPEDVEILLAIADICITIEKLDLAKGFYNKVLEIEPWNSKAWKTLQSFK